MAASRPPASRWPDPIVTRKVECPGLRVHTVRRRSPSRCMAYLMEAIVEGPNPFVYREPGMLSSLDPVRSGKNIAGAAVSVN